MTRQHSRDGGRRALEHRAYDPGPFWAPPARTSQIRTSPVNLSFSTMTPVPSARTLSISSPAASTSLRLTPIAAAAPESRVSTTASSAFAGPGQWCGSRTLSSPIGVFDTAQEFFGDRGMGRKALT